MIKLSDYVFKRISEYGIKDVFMLSGGGCMHLVNSLGKNENITYRCCLFEQVVSLAACAYAQYTNDIGVGLVTTGPGGTNAVTGVANAWSDSIPLMMISGQVKTADISYGNLRTLGFQEIDIVSVVKPITKYAVTVLEPNRIAYELEKCLYIAREGRPGPVWLDIPLDVQASMIDEEALEHFEPEPITEKGCILDSEKLISLIKSSKRPVFIGGYGIKMAGAETEFAQVAKRLNIPVLLTWKAMDLLEDDNELFYGRPGCIGQRCANFIQQNSDLIISVGARLDFGQIGYNHLDFAPKAKKIIVDIDKEELGKFKFETQMSIQMDAGEFLRQLNEAIEDITYKPEQDWLEYCVRMKHNYPVVTKELIERKDGISSYYLMQLLHEHTDEFTVFAPGNSGACSEVFCQSYRVKNGQRVVTSNTLGSMGTGLPCAIGACVASQMSETICLNGDGGFQMNIQDLETVRRLSLPIKFFVLNNQGYGSIRNSQDNYFGGFYVGAEKNSGVTTPELERIAYAYKIPYYKITSNDEMKNKIPHILKEDGPVLCEMMISMEERTMPRTTSKILEDGKMVSVPQEDLFPFLPRDEFEDCMKISR